MREKSHSIRQNEYYNKQTARLNHLENVIDHNNESYYGTCYHLVKPKTFDKLPSKQKHDGWGATKAVYSAERYWMFVLRNVWESLANMVPLCITSPSVCTSRYRNWAAPIF